MSPSWRLSGTAPGLEAAFPDLESPVCHKSTASSTHRTSWAPPGRGTSPRAARSGSSGCRRPARGARASDSGATARTGRTSRSRGVPLYAVEADTSQPFAKFVEDNRVLMTREGERARPSSDGSGPLHVVGGAVVVAGLRGEAGDRAQFMEREPKEITAFDVRTGRQIRDTPLPAGRLAFPPGTDGPGTTPGRRRGMGVHMPTLPDADRGMPRSGVSRPRPQSSGSATPPRRARLEPSAGQPDREQARKSDAERSARDQIQVPDAIKGTRRGNHRASRRRGGRDVAGGIHVRLQEETPTETMRQAVRVPHCRE